MFDVVHVVKDPNHGFLTRSATQAIDRTVLTFFTLHPGGSKARNEPSGWGGATIGVNHPIEAALVRVQEQPDLLRGDDAPHPDLRFYRMNKHLLVCDVQRTVIILLTVIHASRDMPSRLAEMAPTLVAEVELLHKKLLQAKRR